MEDEIEYITLFERWFKPEIKCPVGEVVLPSDHLEIYDPQTPTDQRCPHKVAVENPKPDDVPIIAQAESKKAAILGAKYSVMTECVKLGCYDREKGCYRRRTQQ